METHLKYRHQPVLLIQMNSVSDTVARHCIVGIENQNSQTNVFIIKR